MWNTIIIDAECFYKFIYFYIETVKIFQKNLEIPI